MGATGVPIGGELLGYRIDEMVGRGGMGVVYRAYDSRLKRSVALKLIAPERSADDHFRERFLAESELAASLEHPNVVPIYDAGEVDGRLYLVMRYVEGRDLKTLLQEQGSLDAARALAICAQLADALDAAHERGLVHRDVKPSNVLLDKRERTYLTDFGLSRRLADLAPGLAATASLGTPAYVAPEQIRGDEADGRADQYSLACVLYETLSGGPPFRRESELGVLWAHVEEEPPTLPGLEEVLAKGLAKEPENRFARCTEFVQAAQEALGIAHPTPSRVRLPVLLGLAGLVLVSAAVATYFALRGGGEPHARGDTLVRIDPATNKVAESIPVGPRASSVAFGDGYVWVTDREERTLWRVDPETGTTRATKVTGGPPLDVAVRNGLAAVAYGPLPVGLELIDTASGASEWTYRLPGADGAPAPLAAGADGIWVAAAGFDGENVGRVVRAAAASGSPGAIEQVPITEDPNYVFSYTSDSGSYNDVAVDKEAVWLVRDAGPVLKRVDSKEMRVVATIQLPFRPKSVAVGGGAVWVTGILDDAVARLDPQTARVTLTVPLPPGTDGVAVAEGSVWVASTIAGTVTRIDPWTGEILATIDVGPRPEDVAVGDGGIWVTTHTA